MVSRRSVFWPLLALVLPCLVAAEEPTEPSGFFRVHIALPGAIAGETGELRLDLIAVGPHGLEIDGAGDPAAIPGLPPTSLRGEAGLLFRRQADEPFQPGYHRFVSEPIVALADLRASFHYRATGKELEICPRCDLVAEEVYDSATETAHREILSGHALAVRFPAELRRQLELTYNPETLDRAEIEIESVPWEVSPSIRQEPTQGPAYGTGDVAPGTLLHSGEMTLEATDLTIRGRGFDFAFVRTYRSGTLGSGPLGPGWDHSYRQRLRALPNGDVEYYDGRGRRETFRREEQELVSPPGRFATLKRVSGGWVMLEAHGNRLHFDRWGRLESIADAVRESASTGNVMRFHYDTRSRLVRVVDTLGRYVHLHYDAAGRLVRTIDFTGREVLYVHDAAGRLIEVRSPPVALAGGEAPQRLVTRYAYESPSGDLATQLRQRDDLVAVTDPKGQIWLEVTYGDADGDGIAGEVTAQRWGEGSLTIAYDLSARRTTVTDRRGNLVTYHHNATGQVIRIEDPVGAVWQMAYDGEGLETSRTEPLGRVTTTTYEQEGSRRARGNALEVRVTPDSRGENGSSAQLVTTIEYHEKTNLPVKVIDARNNEAVIGRRSDGLATSITEGFGSPAVSTTRFGYNAFGQPIRVENPNGNVSTLDYFESGPSRGYLRETLVDPGGLDLKTAYTTDARGNVTSVTGPRNVRNEAIYNDLDWLAEERRGVTGSNDGAPPLGYVYETIYDRNGNVAEERIPYRTSQATKDTYRYGILNELLEEEREIEPGGPTALTVYERDPNLNVIRVTDPVGNQREASYDERNLPVATVRGLGSQALAEPILETLTYNLDRERTSFTNGRLNSWTTLYDGYGRVRQEIDPLGNTREIEYDGNGNVTRMRARQTGGLLLADNAMSYDALDRESTSTAWLWEEENPDDSTLRPEGAEAVTTTRTYDPASNLTSVTDPLGRQTSLAYDAAERLVSTTDPAGNVATLELDAAGNVKSQTTAEVGTGLGAPAATITETFKYDALDRRIRGTEGEGNTTEWSYDARDLLRRVVDPEGFFSEQLYDGLNRRVRAVQPEGIVVDTAYDAASRMVSLSDARGNTTSWAYDAADRPTLVTYADGTTEAYAYDAADNLIQRIDGNGTTVTQVFDNANRMTSRSAVAAGGYELRGAETEGYIYDGLDRLRLGQSGAIGTQLVWDSLSRVVEETHAGKTVRYALDAVGNARTVTYPSGVTVDQSFDPLDRVVTSSVAGFEVASYGYRGAHLRAQKRLAGDLDGVWTFDQARRPVQISYLGSPVTRPQVERLGWSPRSLKVHTVREDLGHTGWSLGHDGAERLDAAAFGRFDPEAASLSALPPFRLWGYDLDNAQNLVNRSRTDRIYGQDDEGNTTPHDFIEEATMAPDARNRPTELGGQDGVRLAYDGDGNLVQRGGDTLRWDFRNRLAEVELAGGGKVEYAYDVFNRLIRTTREDGLGGTTIEEQVWSGLREVEGYRDGALVERHIRGTGLDEIVRSTHDVDHDGTLDTDYYPLYDSTGNLTTLLGPSLHTIARYRYSPYSELLSTEVDSTPPAIPQVRMDPEIPALHFELSEEVARERLEDAHAKGEIAAAVPASPTAGGAAAKTTTALALTLEQPIITGHRTGRRFTLTPLEPPEPGTMVTLTIAPEALADLFGNQATAPLELTFEWPAPPAAVAGDAATKVGEPEWIVLYDDTPPRVERLEVLEGHLYVALSEPPNLAGVQQAFTVDGQTIAWTLLPDDYTVRSLEPLAPGSHDLDMATGVPVDLAGNGLAQPVDESIENVGDKLIIRPVNPRLVPFGTLPNRFAFHGRPVDPDTGFVYFRNRWVSPETGRFLSPDPMGYADGPSLYQFANYSPANFGDPLGLFGVGLGACGAKVGAPLQQCLDLVEARARAFDRNISAALQNPYLQGPLMVAGGIGEGAAGAYAAAQTGGLAAVPGWLAMVHGADLAGAGFRTIWTGQIQETGTRQVARTALTAVGMTPEASDFGATLFDAGVSGFALAGSARVFSGLAPSPRPSREVVRLAEGRRLATRHERLLERGAGLNVSPEAWFKKYPELGGSGQSFITDADAVWSILGPMKPDATKLRVGWHATHRLERALGLEPQSLQRGFRITVVPDVASQAPAAPLVGNRFFRGPGQGLPGGGPELVIRALPTRGSALRQIQVTVQ